MKQKSPSEVGHDKIAIGCRGGIALCGLGVALAPGFCFVALLVEENLAGLAIESEETPLMDPFVFGGSDVAVEAEL